MRNKAKWNTATSWDQHTNENMKKNGRTNENEQEMNVVHADTIHRSLIHNLIRRVNIKVSSTDSCYKHIEISSFCTHIRWLPLLFLFWFRCAVHS